MESIFVIVCYDIPDTKVRNRLILFLLSCGLSRVQLSVFSGEIPATRVNLIVQQLQRDFPRETDKILIASICKTCVSHLVHLHGKIPQKLPSYIVL
ncbi:MAG: CRISPR-associated endonuclease Cas2 [Methanoregula sp.]|nr:CRISPR-associated endonuclease Cas2 [Methanoregula sp.]